MGKKEAMWTLGRKLKTIAYLREENLLSGSWGRKKRVGRAIRKKIKNRLRVRRKGVEAPRAEVFSDPRTREAEDGEPRQKSKEGGHPVRELADESDSSKRSRF